MSVEIKCDVEIIFPRHIKNDYNGFDFLASLYEKVYLLKNKHILLRFNKTTWYEANLVSPLGSLIELLFGNNCNVSIDGVSNSIQTIFKKNGFYSRYKLGSTIDTYNSTIGYRVFHIEEEEEFITYLNDEVIPKIRLDITKSQVKSFKLCLQELFVNVNIHAESEYLFAAGQYYHQNKKVAFTISDIGKTIGTNVRNKLNSSIDDCEAIDWASEYNNTTKVDENGGLGLHIIKEYLKDSGDFHIISGYGYWELKSGILIKKTLSHYFGGTIVNIISNLEKTFVQKESTNIFI